MTFRTFLIILIFFVPWIAYGSGQIQLKDTVFNQTDNNGLKQGYWKKKYPDGGIKYRGQFLNDKPVGTFKRYYPKGAIQSVQSFRENGSSYVRFYYETGVMAAEGKFLGTKKDSIWKYYSYYGGYLSYVEVYRQGLKNGISKKFYKDGKVSQELSWKKGVKNGPWKIWFRTGQLQLTASFVEGRLDGPFTTYYPDGDLEISGTYKNDIRVGTWTLTDPATKKPKQIKYINGVREDQEKIDKAFEEQLNKIEKSKGNIKEPGKNFIKRR